MAIEIQAEELSPAEYLGITPDLLPDHRGTDNLRLLSAKVPASGVRLVLAIPPNGYCWGMRLGHTAAWMDWYGRELRNPVTAAAFRAMFSGLGLDPYQVPETLAHGFFQDDIRRTSPEAPDLPQAWFRAEFLPDGPRPFEDFVRRLRAHIAQLGIFFLLPRSDRGSHGEVSAWAETVDSNLEDLFGSDHDADLWGYGGSPQRRIEALEEALRAVSRAQAETWLTPRFLEREPAIPEYPMAETPPAYMYKGDMWFMKGLPARSPEEVYRDRMTLSRLRAKLLRKWAWPVGIRHLQRRRDWTGSRKSALEGPPWPALEAEVTELLKEAAGSYPVLFE